MKERPYGIVGDKIRYAGPIWSTVRDGCLKLVQIKILNSGAHANPCFAGDTVKAWSEVLDRAPTDAPGVGAIRLRLVATKGSHPKTLKTADGKYDPDVLLDLDYWALMPI